MMGWSTPRRWEPTSSTSQREVTASAATRSVAWLMGHGRAVAAKLIRLAERKPIGEASQPATLF